MGETMPIRPGVPAAPGDVPPGYAAPAEASDLVGARVLAHAAAIAQATGWGAWTTLGPELQYHFREVALADLYATLAQVSPARATELVLEALPTTADDAILDLQLQARTWLPRAVRLHVLRGLVREGRVVERPTHPLPRYWRVR
jgi:hypothetical protein